MVEYKSIYYLGLGYVIQGFEEVSWSSLSDTLELIDATLDSSITSSNNQFGTHFRSTRLDRVYISKTLTFKWQSITSSIDNSIQLSDLYPLLLTVSAKSIKSG